LQEVSEAAVEWARTEANANIARLQRPESAKDFAGFMANLVSVTRGKVETAYSGPKGRALDLALANVERQVYGMMQPFHRRFVQLARQDVAGVFNTAVGEDMPVSCEIMQDLNKAKMDAVKMYSKQVNALKPKSAPPSWDTGFDAQQLAHSLDVYIDEREEQARIQGILPRSRKPVDISLHCFVNHPLGRDSRANPLLAGDRDVLMYDEKLARSGIELSSPEQVQAACAADDKRGKEFAREMLMFPLSVKNPDVPLMGGRSRRQKEPPQLDHQRDKSGPERFIDWDMEALQPIKRAIQKSVKAAQKEAAEADSTAQQLKKNAD
jgi:hypothetical protein